MPVCDGYGIEGYEVSGTTKHIIYFTYFINIKFLNIN